MIAKYLYAIFRQVGAEPTHHDEHLNNTLTTQSEVAREVEQLHQDNPSQRFYFIRISDMPVQYD